MVRSLTMRGEHGSALVEAALALPAVLAFAFGVVSAGRIADAQIAVRAAAREAGRALATAPSPTEGLRLGRERALAEAAGHGLASERFEVTLDAGGFTRGGVVRVQTSYRLDLGALPLFHRADLTLRECHVERVERYRDRTGP